ncbi:MAG: GNAT family N-acetyltransferase, partial [Mailhella sp.]|nr:GNAT family N-acetyltransferase [Mailhella sp.]
MAQTGASECFVIAPELPERLKGNELDSDVYYTLDAASPTPEKLRRHVRRAREALRVDETREFTAEHRRLWTEFMGRLALPPHIRQLYAGTASALRGSADLRL